MKDTWPEQRREMVRDMTLPINLLAREIAGFERERSKLATAGQQANARLVAQQVTLERVLYGILYSQHLTIGSYSCTCGACRPMLAPDQSMTGEVRKYRKGVHEVAEAVPDAKQDEWVKVIRPFIGDNLLYEQIQPVTVVPLRFLRLNEPQQEGPH